MCRKGSAATTPIQARFSRITVTAAPPAPTSLATAAISSPENPSVGESVPRKKAGTYLRESNQHPMRSFLKQAVLRASRKARAKRGKLELTLGA